VETNGNHANMQQPSLIKKKKMDPSERWMLKSELEGEAAEQSIMDCNFLIFNYR